MTASDTNKPVKPNSSDSPSERKAARVLGVFLIVLGALMLSWAPYSVFFQRQSLDWPSAPGRVTKASVVTKAIRAGGSQKVGLRPRYYPVIEYAFEVDGREYVGDTISFVGESPASKDRKATQRFVQSFVDQTPLLV
ncbi:MAG: hypothetical protein ACOX6T_01710 [Myxococcales bacterium]|jgi:hypothetical protein